MNPFLLTLPYLEIYFEDKIKDGDCEMQLTFMLAREDCLCLRSSRCERTDDSTTDFVLYLYSDSVGGSPAFPKKMGGVANMRKDFVAYRASKYQHWYRPYLVFFVAAMRGKL